MQENSTPSSPGLFMLFWPDGTGSYDFPICRTPIRSQRAGMRTGALHFYLWVLACRMKKGRAGGRRQRGLEEGRLKERKRHSGYENRVK